VRRSDQSEDEGVEGTLGEGEAEPTDLLKLILHLGWRATDSISEPKMMPMPIRRRSSEPGADAERDRLPRW